ncbi:hypothetical protein Bca101_019942 [Brassica carinata]
MMLSVTRMNGTEANPFQKLLKTRFPCDVGVNVANRHGFWKDPLTTAGSVSQCSAEILNLPKVSLERDCDGRVRNRMCADELKSLVPETRSCSELVLAISSCLA